MLQDLKIGDQMDSIATAIDNQDYMEYHAKALNIKAQVKWIAASRLFYSV